jgi:membrane protein implicated in regulation of membrane protease activity
MNVKRKGSKGAGAALLFLSIAAFIVYAYFLLGTEWGLLILQFTALAAVAILLTVLGWIGFTMLTAPREEEEKQG